MPERKQPHLANLHVEQDGVTPAGAGAMRPGLVHQRVELVSQRPQRFLNLAGQDLGRLRPVLD